VPQFCHDSPEIRPPSLQFRIRHQWLALTHLIGLRHQKVGKETRIAGRFLLMKRK
jgi:hypothetical protein